MALTNTNKLLAAPYPSWIYIYWQKICAGEILVGRRIKQNMQRLLADFEDPDVHIDLEDSDKRIRFIQNECKLYEAPFAGKPFRLELFQKAIIESIYAIKVWSDEAGRFVRKYHDVLLMFGRKNGKALDINTEIPTPDGWKKMGDLQIGDTVFAVDGKPAKIITTSPIRRKHDCYRVTFEDGAEIMADGDHLWTVTTKKKRWPFVITTREMLCDFACPRKDGKGTEYKYRVPMQLPVRYPEKQLPIPPYVLGLWLGNGDSSDGRICGDAKDMAHVIEQIWKAGEEITSRTTMRGACDRINVKGLSAKLRAAGLIKNKHIPQEYLQGSIDQRMELLQGLMDTDGTCSKSGQCEFVQKSKVITDGIMELLDSLGIKNTVHEHIPTINGKACDKVYRVQFWTDKTKPCFKLWRKYDRLKTRLSSRMANKSIRNIEPIPSVPVKCIGIDHHSHLYLAGRKFTATHNTPLASAISLSEFICGEMGTKVLFGSNDYDQADLAFQAADAMREESPKIERCTRRNNKGIFFGNPKHKVLKGKFSYQNKGSIRKISAHGKNKEGRNIKVGVVDEVHEMQDNSLVAPIRQALSTQEEPLYFEITTEGFTDDGYLDQRLAEAEKVLDGEIDRPDWVIWWFCQDSEEEVWQDESSWVKSNPGLGAIKKWSYLRKQVDEARTNSSTRAFVLSKDFNIKQNSAVAWLSSGDIENPATIDMSLLRGRLALGGVDLAETTDLCSARLFIELPEPVNGYRRFTFGMYFIPEIKADAELEDNNLNPERKNYREWEKQGLVTICPGTEVDDDMVVDWFVGIYEEFGIIPYKVGFDNWHSKAFKSRFAEVFGEDVLERVGMDFMSLSGAMRALEADLQRKALNYDNNEMDRWCLKNTAVKTNNIGLIMPVKKYGTSKNRIDGALSGIITYAVLNRFRSEYRSAQMMR